MRFEGFEDAAEAGWGGFGVVYRARQAGFDREVAIKVLSLRPGADIGQAFRQECAAIGSLSGHPNIVTVHGLGETADGRPFIVMEYLHGGSLGDVVRAQGPIAWREAAEIGVALAGALESAHRAGLLHRDVKPENVLLSRFGQPKLGDFGIARLHAAAGGRGVVAGSPRHLAPEVLDGDPPTVASDVYSLGSTLFTILTGRPPDGAMTSFRPEAVPDSIWSVIQEALSREPDQRQETAEELGRKLQVALAMEGSKVPPLPVDEPGRGWRGRRTVIGAAFSGALLVAAAVTMLAQGPRSTAGKEAVVPSTTIALARPSTPTATTTPPPRPGTFTDDFSARRWPVFNSEPNGYVVFDYVDGQYLIALEAPPGNQSMGGPPQYAPVSATPAHMVRIAVDATKRTATRGDFGVACGGPTSQFPYAALVDIGGWWRIVQLSEDASRPVDVRSGRDERALVGQGPHRIELECVGEGEEISVALRVAGVELATGSGRRGSSFGQGPGLMGLPFTTRIEVLFDNFELAYS